MDIWIGITSINESEGYTIYKEGPKPYEGKATSLGELFRDLQEEHGRCVGKVYVDTKNVEAIPVGWVFEKKELYRDIDEHYTKATWVSLYEPPPPPPRIHYHPLEVSQYKGNAEGRRLRYETGSN